MSTGSPGAGCTPRSWRLADGVFELLEGPPGALDVPGAHHVDARIPVRLLNLAWHRLEWPPVEWFAGQVDIAHSLHPLLIPSRAAARIVTIHDLVLPRSPGADRRGDPARLSRPGVDHASRADGMVVNSPATGRSSIGWGFRQSHHRLSSWRPPGPEGADTSTAADSVLGHARAAQKCRALLRLMPRSCMRCRPPRISSLRERRGYQLTRAVREHAFRRARRPCPRAIPRVCERDRTAASVQRSLRCLSFLRSTKGSASRRSKP